MHQLLHCWPHSVTENFLKHLARLQMLNFALDQDILDALSNKNGFNNYFMKCKRELSTAKNTKLPNSWITFFNLVNFDKKKFKNWAGNKDLIEGFNSSGYLLKFPIYGVEMKRNVEKGIKRRKLFDKSAVSLTNCLPILNPTHLIIRDMLDKLRTKDLTMFCE